MADRNHPSSNGNALNHGAARPGPPINPRGSATLAGVRRNLFQGHGQQPSRARRPTPAALAPNHSSNSISSGNSSADTVRPDADVPNSDATEIVVRDRHGEIEWGEPPSPDLDDQGDLPLENQREEIEQERQRLAEAVKSHQINSSAVPDQPEELLEAVRANLRAKVAALAEDNWMYEPEEQGRMP